MGLFAEKGFDNVPVEAICERAGISRATFFNYFPQKDMILAAVGAARIETMRGLLADKLGGRRTLKLRHVISLFVDFAAENEELGSQGKDLFLQILFALSPARRTSNSESSSPPRWPKCLRRYRCKTIPKWSRQRCSPSISARPWSG